MISQTRSTQTMFVSLLVLILMAGCSDNDKITQPTDGGPLNNTEVNVLANFVSAYVEKDIDAYTEVFDVEEFTFVFDRTDVENDPDLNPTWGWPEELTSTKNMFSSALVLTVTVDFVLGDVEFARDSDLVPLEWRKIVVTEIELEIDTIDPDGGENIIYKVAGDRGMFFFGTYPDELIDGQPRKRITEWRDIRVGLRPGLAVELNTWGQIKSVWN